jgi:hypothetical protein
MMVAPEGTTVGRLLSAQLVSVNEASTPRDLTTILSLAAVVARGVAGRALAEPSGAPTGVELIEGAGEDDALENQLPQDTCARASRPATPARTPLRIGR